MKRPGKKRKLNLVDEKKDLTSLVNFPPADADGDSDTTGATLEFARGSFDDIPPLGPSDDPSESDPLADLPPLDPEIEKLATGEEEPFSPNDFVPSPSDSLETDDPSFLPTHPRMDSFVPPSEPAAPSPAPAQGMDDLRHYSDHVAPAANEVTAETPFSVLIDGFLKTHEREALMAILNRENLGIREVELEPQFDAGRVLIPRISEFAGVLIVQALRNASVKMRLGHSEKIFAAKSAEDEDRLIFPPVSDSEMFLSEESGHPADRILLSPDDEVKGQPIRDVLDTLHGSMNLKSAHVAIFQSPFFADALEKLKRQLKFQAHHRGANALLSFKYELHPLEGQTIYKLVVQAKAVRL